MAGNSFQIHTNSFSVFFFFGKISRIFQVRCAIISADTKNDRNLMTFNVLVHCTVVSYILNQILTCYTRVLLYKYNI